MDICYVVIAAICLSPDGLEHLNVERAYGFSAVAQYAGMTVRVLDGDNVVKLKGDHREICVENECMSYRLDCSIFSDAESCVYTIQRDSRIEYVSIAVESASGRLPVGWEAKFRIMTAAMPSRFFALENERE